MTLRALNKMTLKRLSFPILLIPLLSLGLASSSPVGLLQQGGASLTENHSNYACAQDLDWLTQGIPLYIGAANGKAFFVEETSDGVKACPIKTSLPVFKAFGLAADRRSLLYIPLKNDVPSGELYVEDLLTGSLRKISSHLVLEAAWSPTNPNYVAYTFSGGDVFGLATVDLNSDHVRVLVSDHVLADILQWDESGERIYYFQAIDEVQPVLDSVTFNTVQENSYAVLSPRYVTVNTGISEGALPSDLPTGFPMLNQTIVPEELSQPITKEMVGLPENLYSFRTFSPNRSHEVLGDSLLGSGILYARSLPSGKPRPIGEGQLLKVLHNGIVVKVFTDVGTKFQFIAWDGQTTELATTSVSYRLPLRSFILTQGGASYSYPGNCQICSGGGWCSGTYSHTSGSRMEYAYDMQSSTIGAHVLASADGLVVYTYSSVTCNSCDSNGCGYYSRGCASNSGAGNTVIIQHSDGTYTKYSHMQPNSIQVSVNSNVCQGLYIGRQGHTGCTVGNMNGCGDHLHFQRQSTSSLLGQSIPISFSDVTSNPLSCGSSYTSGSTERTSCGGGVINLQNDVPVSNLLGAQGSQQHFKIVVPSGVASLAVTISGGSGDADLYVRRGSQPTLSTYDCRPYTSGNNETCNFTNPANGDWYIMLHGYSAYSGVTLRAKYTTGTSCISYSINPTNQSFSASGGSGSVSVTAGSGCSWTAISNASWITITSGSSGTGNGTVNYSVAANSSTSSRTGTMTIAGQPFTVTQAGAGGGVPTVPTGLSPGSANPDGSVRITMTPVTLRWNASSGANRYEVIVYYWNWATSAWVYHNTYTTTTNSLSYSPPVNSTHYAWVVRAGNASGWSGWSNWAYFYFQR